MTTLKPLSTHSWILTGTFPLKSFQSMALRGISIPDLVFTKVPSCITGRQRHQQHPQADVSTASLRGR